MADIQVMMLAIIQRADADQAVAALTHASLRITVISSVGSFLRESNTTLLLGLAHTEVSLATRILSTQCAQRTKFVNAASPSPTAGFIQIIDPIEVQIGGAVIFTFRVDQYVRICQDYTEHTFEPREDEERATATKLLLVVLPQDWVSVILADLSRAEYNVTLVSTTGGFLRKGNATLLIGVEFNQVVTVLALVEKSYTKHKKMVLGQTINIFVLDAKHYRQANLETMGKI